MDVKLLLTIPEAAGRLGVGRSKVYELVASGALESILIDSARRIPSDALEAFVARLRREAQEARESA